MVGDATHIPCCMVALVLLFQCVKRVSAIPQAAYLGLERHMPVQDKDSVWQPGLAEAFPGLLTWADVQAEVQSSFVSIGASLPQLQAGAQLSQAVARLQVYWVDSQLRGRVKGRSGCNRKPKRQQPRQWAFRDYPKNVGKDACMKISQCLAKSIRRSSSAR